MGYLLQQQAKLLGFLIKNRNACYVNTISRELPAHLSHSHSLIFGNLG